MSLSRRSFVAASAGAAAGALLKPTRTQSAALRKPNIVLVMTDDQGYGDLACHGNPIVRTPTMDRLHAESTRFTHFHVSPTCSPTRASLLTGMHEFKSGVTHTILERERLSLKRTILPQVLKSQGYTTGIFGKWHLGDEDAYQPDHRGFDEVLIHGGGGIGQTYPGSCGDAPGNTYFNPVLKYNGRFVKTRGFCTDVFFAFALRWMEQQVGKRPFFAYIPTNAAHAPLQCPDEYWKPYADKVKERVARFYGMITNIDDNLARLSAKLREWGIEKETLLIFMTDNGSATGANVFNAGMRGRKGSPYEGGSRVPSFWHWPGTFPAGVDRNQLTAHIDVLPTLAELTGANLPPDLTADLDGRSLLPLLRGTPGPWPDRLLFIHVGRWPRGKATQWKLHSCAVHGPRYKLVHSGRRKADWELYDLQEDFGETTNVLARHPDLARQYRTAFDAWWQQVLPRLENEKAVGPKVNPFKAEYWKQFGGGPQPGR